MLTLLRAAAELVPELVEYELVEAVAGLRPGTPDNARSSGRCPVGRACSPRRAPPPRHRAHPVTAGLVTELIVSGEPDPALAPFTPDRFGKERTWN
ncbi:hypothetical protein [Micromonospora sp. WMMB482]|uniref:hypothetical protein n=1 Tax=Micromonospora sp. WMMB482 TaxID=2849653 RepID=UPI0035AE14F9